MHPHSPAFYCIDLSVIEASEFFHESKEKDKRPKREITAYEPDNGSVRLMNNAILSLKTRMP